MIAEEWRDIPGWTGLYQVSSHGRVKSLARSCAQRRWAGTETTRHVRERILRPFNSGERDYKRPPYRLVRLYRDGAKTQRKVHQLVAEAFLPPEPFADALLLHRDDNQLNNHVENLRWGTHAENQADRRRNRMTFWSDGFVSCELCDCA